MSKNNQFEQAEIDTLIQTIQKEKMDNLYLVGNISTP